jgi:hypothetical protein
MLFVLLNYLKCFVSGPILFKERRLITKRYILLNMLSQYNISKKKIKCITNCLTIA